MDDRSETAPPAADAGAQPSAAPSQRADSPSADSLSADSSQSAPSQRAESSGANSPSADSPSADSSQSAPSQRAPSQRAESSGAPSSRSPNSPPSFWFVFDWRLVVTLVLLALIGVMSCDIVNLRLDRYSETASGTVPDPAAWTAGSKHEVDITLITKDEGRLDCSDDRELSGVHCGYKKDRVLWPSEPGGPIDENKLHVVQPYRSAVGNHLVLVAGLWATPALALRHHQESPRGVPEKDLKRFVARCRLEFLGNWDNLDVRWGSTSKWYAEKSAPIARAEWCDIVKGE